MKRMIDLNEPPDCFADGGAVGGDVCQMGGERKNLSGQKRLREEDSLQDDGNGVEWKCNDRVVRQPNVTCKVKSFGEMCRGLGERQVEWVVDMGFGGLLNLQYMYLPRSMCYWLMTCVHGDCEMLVIGGRQYRLSANQVRWVLGLPKGNTDVPRTVVGDGMREKVVKLQREYGQMWLTIEKKSGKTIRRTRFSISSSVVERLLGCCNPEHEEEFKTLFLMTSLDMVLCPTQCQRMSTDLVPAVTCALDAKRYDWCSLVLSKLMASASRVRTRMDLDGYASGCGGCTIFLAIFYLDRLNRNPVLWGVKPRLKVWTPEEIRKACAEDSSVVRGQFGAVGVIDVAYGEDHPREARDLEWPSDGVE